MNSRDHITHSSDSLIALLTAQCSDLEQLLRLARAEASAVEQQNFETVLEIVSQRAELGARLETFQHRIMELRGFLGRQAEPILASAVGRHVAELAALTLDQDRRTNALLVAARDETAAELNRLDSSQTKLNHYYAEPNKGLAYSRNV